MMSSIFFLRYNNICFVPTALIFLLLTYNGLKSAVSIFIEPNGSCKTIPDGFFSINEIFQPFFTTKPTGEGTGLGLSMSYDIITKGHQGELKVDTEEGKGTIFTIILPNDKNL